MKTREAEKEREREEKRFNNRFLLEKRMSGGGAGTKEDFIRIGDDVSFFNEEHGHGFMCSPLSTKGRPTTLQERNAKTTPIPPAEIERPYAGPLRSIIQSDAVSAVFVSGRDIHRQPPYITVYLSSKSSIVSIQLPRKGTNTVPTLRQTRTKVPRWHCSRSAFASCQP